MPVLSLILVLESYSEAMVGLKLGIGADLRFSSTANPIISAVFASHLQKQVTWFVHPWFTSFNFFKRVKLALLVHEEKMALKVPKAVLAQQETQVGLVKLEKRLVTQSYNRFFGGGVS